MLDSAINYGALFDIAEQRGDKGPEYVRQFLGGNNALKGMAISYLSEHGLVSKDGRIDSSIYEWAKAPKREEKTLTESQPFTTQRKPPSLGRTPPVSTRDHWQEFVSPKVTENCPLRVTGTDPTAGKIHVNDPLPEELSKQHGTFRDSKRGACILRTFSDKTVWLFSSNGFLSITGTVNDF